MESLERPLKEAVEADIGPSGLGWKQLANGSQRISTMLQIGESRPQCRQCTRMCGTTDPHTAVGLVISVAGYVCCDSFMAIIATEY